MFILAHVAVLVPYRIGFDVHVTSWSPTWWWELGVDIYFWVDIWLNFTTAFRVDGKVALCKDELVPDQATLIVDRYNIMQRSVQLVISYFHC